MHFYFFPITLHDLTVRRTILRVSLGNGFVVTIEKRNISYTRIV